MGSPYSAWGTAAGFPGAGYGAYGPSAMFALPAIPPSSSPFVTNPEAAVRDMVEHATGADPSNLARKEELDLLKEMAKNDDHRKIIMAVIKGRLDLPWPYNYKALDVLENMPAGEILDCKDKLEKLATLATTVYGAPELKRKANPLVEKAKTEATRKEEEDAKKQQETIAAMWGGLWSNPPRAAADQWSGWPYPYGSPPGVAAAQSMAWPGRPQEGWNPWVTTCTPYPQPSYSYYPPPPIVYGWPGRSY
ncbi:hypothetical protein P7C73_g5852, partial [Tremellales sp. Uapishka_1]